MGHVTGEAITHAQALDLIDTHLGETVYVGFLVASAQDGPEGEMSAVVHVVGELGNPLDPRSPRLDPGVGFYGVGRHWTYAFAPMVGTVHLRDNGIDFRPSDEVLIRVAWRGSGEVGDWRPTREAMAKFNALGIRLPEHERPGVVLPSEGSE
jgi:hypothetical protein